MKIEIYCFRSHKLNTKSVSLFMWGVLWFVGRLMFSQALGYEARRCERIFGPKKIKNWLAIISTVSAKKKTILNPATIEYPLNDSLFSSFNGTSLMRWWIYECYKYIKIAGWRNKSTGDHDSEIRNLCCWEKKACVTQIFFSHLIFDSFIAVSLYFLANMRGSSALIWTA